jgi:hypothetical protein
MAKASKRRGKKKAAKSAKKRSKKSVKRAPAKRKGAKRKPAKRKPAKRAPKQTPQAEPWPMIFAVALILAAALIAGWYVNGPAQAMTVGELLTAPGITEAADACIPALSKLSATAPVTTLLN